ncbi:MAG: hypothetical protein Q9168_007804 [Polycauliona sp. 1 TL-2023]
MHLYSQITTGALLLCGLSHALPGLLVKRTFTIDNDKCPRSQDDKDLIKTEFGIAQDMAQAVAASGLTSDNKWTKYFFDDETIKDPKAITSYYGKLRDVYDDSSYKVAITCPTKKGDADWDVCGVGEWASTQSIGNKRIALCPIFFDGYKNYIQEDSKTIASNCKTGAKGEKNWRIIEQFKGSKAFTILHESSHLAYATDSDKLPPSQTKRARDYAYDRSSCKKLRDGTQRNVDLCSSYDKKICPAEKSFRNADSIAFVAAEQLPKPNRASRLTMCTHQGIYWEKECGKTIHAEVQSGDPDEVEDPGSDTDNPDGSGGATSTSSAGSSNQTSSPPQDPPPAPEPTTTSKEPPKATPTPDPGPCKSGMYSESSCNDSCGGGSCKSGVTGLGQQYYYCDCP